MPDATNGGYILTPGPDGVLRLDSRAGHAPRCYDMGAGCYAIPYERRPLDSEIGRLQRENSGLKAEAKRLRDEAARLKDEAARLKDDNVRTRSEPSRPSEFSRPTEPPRLKDEAAPGKADPAKTDAAKAEAARLADEVRGLKSEIASLKDELTKRSGLAREAAKTGSAAAKADASKNAEEIGGLKSEIANLKGELAKRNAPAAARAETAKLADEITVLKTEIASLRDELSKRNAAAGKIDTPLRKEDSLKQETPKSDSKPAESVEEKSASKPELNGRDAERVMSIVERVWRRLVEMADRLQKDLGGK